MVGYVAITAIVLSKKERPEQDEQNRMKRAQVAGDGGGGESASESERTAAALAESRAYEASREDEARRARFAAEDAAREAARAFAALNGRTRDAIRGLLDGERDATAALRRAAEAYAAEAALVRSKNGVFHASALGFSPTAAASSAAQGEKEAGDDPMRNLIKTFQCIGRGSRRKRLPAPPSEDDRLTGMKLLTQRLVRHGRTIVNVRGDGACQFRAVSVGLWGDEKHHSLVRRKALDAMRARPPEFHDCQVYASRNGRVSTVDVGDDFEAYAAALGDQRSWGDHNTLQACSDMFRARVLLVTTHAENYELIVEPRDCDAVCEIWIGFHSEMHYVAAKLATVARAPVSRPP